MKFVALPVSQGDAFYAETDEGFRVLVDGGRSRHALPNLFQKYTRSDWVHVLVCTHNDADHAEGVIGFLEAGLRCDELWLPATWLDAILSLPQHASETMKFIMEHLPRSISSVEFRPEDDSQEVAWRIVFPEFQEMSPLHRREVELPDYEGNQEAMSFSAAVSKRRVVFVEQSESLVSSDLLAETIDALDEHLDLFNYLSFSTALLWRTWPRPNRMMHVIFRDTRRLLKLARLALDLGIPLRCFQHDPQHASPLPGYPLHPLSAKVQAYVRPVIQRRTPENFLYRAFLTTVNTESLVFYLNIDDHPGVLFTADSDLKNINLQCVHSGDIVTAPHHGSASNRSVYGRFSQPVIWVRSDSCSRYRPCNEYLSALGRRFCTLCRNSRYQKQAVQLYTRQRRWNPYRTRCCHCR